MGKGPDFITIDGGEGGTGAAPLTFADHVALPYKLGFSRSVTENWATEPQARSSRSTRWARSRSAPSSASLSCRGRWSIRQNAPMRLPSAALSGTPA